MIDTFKKATPDALKAIREEMELRKTGHVVLLFSMGSQFDHLIKICLGRIGIFCLVADPASVKVDDVTVLSPAGIIISGGPASVHSEPPPFDDEILNLNIPVLGICLGAQMIAHHVGAEVRAGDKREFSVEPLKVIKDSVLISDAMNGTKVQQSHGDVINADHPRIELLATTRNAPVAAFRSGNLWGVQFHPEVTESEAGVQMLDNFCTHICGITERYPAEDAAKRKIAALASQIGDGDVIIGLSGGCDSSVVAHLVKGAKIGHSGTVYGIYIKGIDRPDDEEHVHTYFGNQDWIRVEIVDATEAFLAALAGKINMKDKRIAMRGVYKEVFEQKVRELKSQNVDSVHVAQGTLYTDLVESGVGHDTGARRAQIKLHHNTKLDFSVPELMPLEDCVKDTARDIGRSIGVPEELLVRHPFPGPGLVVRIEGEVTSEKLEIARRIDGIYIEELRRAGLYDSVWQAGAVLTNSRCTCTKGDDASEGWVVVCWAVWSVNGFTARPARLPYEFMEEVSDRMTNEIREVGSVAFRTSGKPPATIEWG